MRSVSVAVAPRLVESLPEPTPELSEPASGPSRYVLDPFGPIWKWSVLSGPAEGKSGWAPTRDLAKRAALKSIEIANTPPAVEPSAH